MIDLAYFKVSATSSLCFIYITLRKLFWLNFHFEPRGSYPGDGYIKTVYYNVSFVYFVNEVSGKKENGFIIDQTIIILTLPARTSGASDPNLYRKHVKGGSNFIALHCLLL